VALTDEEARALTALDEPATVGLLLDLVRVPSITGSAAESALQHALASRLEALDLDVDLWPMDLGALRASPGFPGTEAPRTEAWGLVGTGHGEDGGEPPALVLCGHVDVVPPGDLAQWSGDPFDARVAGGAVVGRGACDMKAGVAAALAAVAAIRSAGVRLRRAVALHLVVGEEDGGLGAFGTLARGHTGDACVIPEPTGGTLTTACAGALTFTLTVPGRAAHASQRYLGRSALDAYLPIHRALADLERDRNADPDPLLAEYEIPCAISVGTVQGGDWPSTVPDRLVAEGRIGVLLDEDPAAARSALEAVVAETASRDPYLRDHPPTVSWTGGQFASGRLATGHPLRDLVADAVVDTGGARPLERGAPYGSDLRLYTAAGIPTLHYGPGDVALAHAPNESVPVHELLDFTRTLVLLVLRSCGTR
jgi:acetylornithine deacetylase